MQDHNSVRKEVRSSEKFVSDNRNEIRNMFHKCYKYEYSFLFLFAAFCINIFALSSTGLICMIFDNQ